MEIEIVKHSKYLVEIIWEMHVNKEKVTELLCYIKESVTKKKFTID